MENVENHMVLPHADDEREDLPEREATLIDRVEELEAELLEMEHDRDRWQSRCEDAEHERDQWRELAHDTVGEVREVLDGLITNLKGQAE